MNFKMLAIITSISILLAFLFIYLCGFALALFYEIKINKTFGRMRAEIKNLENSRLSMAMLHLKEYKITQDYRRKISEIERGRQFFLEKWLLAPTPKYLKSTGVASVTLNSKNGLI
jgi:hypothetical protein